MGKRKGQRGFSIPDLLIVIAIGGIICGFAVTSFSHARTRVFDTRLADQVETLNYAVAVLEAKGGNFSGFTDPNAILAILKNHQDSQSANLVLFLGAADQMIDPGLMARVAESREFPKGAWRAVWSPGKDRFVLATEGRGVKEFYVAR